MNKPKVVCLCGSTRFMREFGLANRERTLAGEIVLTVAVDFKEEPTSNPEADKDRLDRLHLRKIDLADHVLIINGEEYVGEGTQREIDYALARRKPVYYWSESGGISPRRDYTEMHEHHITPEEAARILAVTDEDAREREEMARKYPEHKPMDPSSILERAIRKAADQFIGAPLNPQSKAQLAAQVEKVLREEGWDEDDLRLLDYMENQATRIVTIHWLGQTSDLMTRGDDRKFLHQADPLYNATYMQVRQAEQNGGDASHVLVEALEKSCLALHKARKDLHDLVMRTHLPLVQNPVDPEAKL
jgi:hypothetical protein